MSEDNWIAKSIVPKSDQLNAEDLLAGPITVTVVDVQRGTAEQPVALIIEGDRQPYKPCKTMRKVLVYCWTDHASNWIGKRLTLYADPEVKWAGIAVGGIRISHMSGIDSPVSLMLSESRGKRKAHKIRPLVETASPSDAFRQQIEMATTSEELDAIAKAIKAARPPKDEYEFLKTMVVTARERLGAKSSE